MICIRRLSLPVRCLSLLLILTLMLSGCQSSKSQTGATLGATMGAVAGSFFGKGAGKLVAIGLGALIGGYIGHEIGGYLDEKDREAVERESVNALALSKDGQTTLWENPDTKARAEFTLANTEEIDRTVPLVRDKRVEKPQTLALIGEPGILKRDANVRLAPSKNAGIATVLQKGDVVLAVGKPDGKNWVLVNRDRHAIGYVHASLLEIDTKGATAAEQPLDSIPEDIRTTQTIRPAANLETVAASYPESKETETYVAEEVHVQTQARTLKMKVESPNGNDDVTVVAAKGTDGAWEIL